MKTVLQRRDPVVFAWVFGLGLATVAFLLGPQYFLFRVLDYLHVAFWRLGEIIGDLSLVARDVVRALAIGLYGTFVLLAILVIRRGGHARAALFWISILFFLLIGQVDMVTESNARWVLALALSGFSAMVMTNRLRQTALVPRRT